MKTYVFKVWLPPKKSAWRKLELRDDHTLTTLHRAIQSAFDFDDDHLYSFFLSGKAWDRNSEYSLPESLDMGMGPYDDSYDEFGQPRRKKGKHAQESEEELDKVAIWSLMVDLPYPETPEAVEATIQTLITKHGYHEAWARRIVNETLADIEIEMGQRDVRRVQLKSLNLQLKQTILYLFDYGDEWRFKVQLVQVNDNAPDNVSYPRIAEVKGDAPEQYMSEEDIKAAEQEASAAFLAQLQATLAKYREPAAAATLFQQDKLTNDDKAYISASLLDLCERVFIPKFGGTAKDDVYSFSLEPYGQRFTIRGFRGLSIGEPMKRAYPELMQLKYRGKGKFELACQTPKYKWSVIATDIPYAECLRLLETDKRFVLY
jgi:hypothetical protein